MSHPRFHLAFPVADLDAAEQFYAEVLGCSIGRRSERWIDFDFRGHQITAHLCENAGSESQNTNSVDGKAVPVRHFGLILDWDEWQRLADALRSRDQSFIIEPHVRFPGQTGEQATMFISDPSGNCLEFKAFRKPDAVFAA